MLLFTNLIGGLVSFFLLSPLTTTTCSELLETPTPSQMAVPVEGHEKETGQLSDRRKLLDTIRKGVVIIKTKGQLGKLCEATSWSGTGFIVDLKKGLIATNQHVVGDTVCTYEIKFSDGTTTTARLKYFDPLHDFAFLKVDPVNLPKKSLALELSDQSPQVNEIVYAMGNSLNDEFSTFKGIVFSIYENLGPFSEQSFRFSGLTVPGASGSPVFSEDGKVVGIIYGGKFVSGAALPIEYVKNALKYLQKETIPPRYSIGITMRYGDLRDSVEAGIITSHALKEYQTAFPEANNKVLIIASRAVGSEGLTKLQGGDIIWKIDNHLIGPELYKFENILNENKEKEITLDVYRKGKPEQVKITPYRLNIDNEQHFIRFAGATWFSHNERSRLMVGDQGPSVFMSPVDSISPFKEMLDNMPLFQPQPIKIVELEGTKLETLDDLEKAIKTIKGKRILVVKYIDLMGTLSFDAVLSADRVERQSLVKYEAKFDTPKVYRFNVEKEEWEIQEIECQ